MDKTVEGLYSDYLEAKEALYKFKEEWEGKKKTELYYKQWKVHMNKLDKIYKAIKNMGSGSIWKVKGRRSEVFGKANTLIPFTIYYINVKKSDLDRLVKLDVKNVYDYKIYLIKARKPLSLKKD